ncbi:MAG: GNAT family N-acetyltransferase [Acidobacteriota bacterium]|nr:GNAT family N-acetyltransferase [Acidobacteriota bacterium]
MKIEKITLEGKFVRLEPLLLDKHFADLCEVGLDADIWQWSPRQIKSEADLKHYIETALDEELRGVSLPFATILKETSKAIGSTRFGSIDAANKRVEIGWTWISPAFHRTFVNTEAKFLMLRHAFETWSCNRVELKTDALNERSRRAILRIGAKEEGVLRKHIVTDSGRLRDTVYFSILDVEWRNGVKENLLNKLQVKS